MSLAVQSVRFWQPQHPLGDMAQNQLGADRRDAGDLDFAEITFDVVFTSVPHAAMRHDRGLAGAKAGLGGAILGGIGIRAGLLAAVISIGRPQYHQLRRLELDPALGERVLYRLVLADRPAEDDALCRVTGGAIERGAPETDCLGGDQDALRVHAVQDIVKSPALL